MLNRRQFLAGGVVATAAGAMTLAGGELFAEGADAADATAKTAHRGTSLPKKSTPMIDAHVHVYKHDPAYPYAAGANPPAQDAPVEDLIKLMRANGVERTVLVQVIHYKWDNRYLGSVLKQYPGKFQGVCRVNPEDPAAPDQLSALTAQGFRGVRLSPADGVEGEWISGPLMPQLWGRCSQLKVPMTVLAPVTRLANLVPLIESNPDLTVVIDHMADCPLDRTDERTILPSLARYPNVFVKISDMWSLSQEAYPYADAQDMVKQLYESFGAQRLMWATNWPVSLAKLPYGKIVELYSDRLNIFTPEDREEVLYKTVQRVWPFEL
jgi:predicted TIM-barrel fold metal-dependent hydrolase